MVESSLKLIEKEFNRYLEEQNHDMEANMVDLNSFDKGNAPEKYREKVLLYCVNIEEETSQRFYSEKTRNSSEYKINRPPLMLNISVVFAANYYLYTKCLRALDKVMNFVNEYRVIDIPNDNNSMRLTLEKVNLDFEQDKNLWAAIGCAKYPYVMYKVRVVEVN